ncbi:MAG: hypothetical protein IKD04_09935 [Clostridia bacterium]|nr:hypothetical protein [Clostridia bacterium]
MSKLYDFEFGKLQAEFRKDKKQFVLNVLEKKEKYFQRLFNHYCSYPKLKFQEGEFLMSVAVFDDLSFIYIQVPEPRYFDFPQIYSVAYCLVYKLVDDEIEPIEIYNIEHSTFGTSCIGHSSEKGHKNFGEITETIEGNIEIVRDIVLGKIKPITGTY